MFCCFSIDVVFLIKANISSFSRKANRWKSEWEVKKIIKFIEVQKVILPSNLLLSAKDVVIKILLRVDCRER